MSLLSFNEFLYESNLSQDVDTDIDSAKINFLKATAADVMSIDECLIFNLVVEDYSPILLEAINTGNYQLINDAFLNENFLQKAKARYDSLKDKISSKGKEALDKVSDASKNLLKVGGDILKPISQIIAKMGELIKNAWDKAQSIIQEALDSTMPELKKRIKSLVKSGDGKKNLISELTNVKSMSGAGVKIIKGEYVSMINKAADTAAKSDESNSFTNLLYCSAINAATELIQNGYSVAKIQEELKLYDEVLLEGEHSSGGLNIPFVSAIMKKIANIPPFKYFHKLEAAVAEKVNSGLDRASIFINKIGGPGPYKFLVIGGLVGVVAGYKAESLTKEAIFSDHGAKILGFVIPGAGVIYSIIKYTGLALAVYGVVSEIVGHDDAGDKDHSKEEKEDNKDKETTDTNKS
jgi:gas vesicle protein